MNLAAQRANRASDADFPAAAADGDVFPAPGFARAIQQAPGFAVFSKHVPALVVGSELQHRLRRKCLNRNHIPEILRNDVRREKIDFLLGIGVPVSPAFDYVSRVATGRGRLYLHPQETRLAVDDAVVSLTLSPRDANAKAESRRSRQERGLRGLSAAFGIGFLPHK